MSRIASHATRWVLLVGLMIASGGCETTQSALRAIPVRREARAAFRQGDYARARAGYAELVASRPTNAIAQYYLGVSHLKLGHPLQAQLALGKALALEPSDGAFTPHVVNQLAEALYRQDRPEDLARFLNRMVNRYGGVRDYLRKAKYLRRIGDPDGAKQTYRTAIEVAEDGDARPYLALADFYRSIGNRAQARRVLRQASYVDPGNPRVTRRLRQYE